MLKAIFGIGSILIVALVALATLFSALVLATAGIVIIFKAPWSEVLRAQEARMSLLQGGGLLALGYAIPWFFFAFAQKVKNALFSPVSLEPDEDEDEEGTGKTPVLHVVTPPRRTGRRQPKWDPKKQ